MDSTRLFYFKAIAESDSLTKAAKKLYISQPALSKSLAALEEELGTSLFNRVAGRLYLNAEGKILLNYVNELDDLFHQIKDRFGERKEKGNTLRIYSMGNYFSFLMKDYFQYDTQPVELKVLSSRDLIESLFSGDADAIIADDRMICPNLQIGLKRIPILFEQLLLMVPQDHDLAGRTHISIHELTEYKVMQHNMDTWLANIQAENEVSLNLSWSVDSETWNYYWSSYNGKIPLCFDSSSSFVVHEQLEARRRKCSILKVDGNYTSRMLYVWYFSQKEEALTDFLKCVKQCFQ